MSVRARLLGLVAQLAPSPVDCVVLALVALGVFLRVHAFSFPQTFLFDEHHFVQNARNYLLHQPDWNDHPPLGKLIIALSMSVFGDTPVGWRAPALMFGAIVVLAGGVVAARLFGNRRAGFLAAALLSADGFMISYSRAGLLDGYLAACAVLSLLLATLEWTAVTAVAAGLLAGIAASIKFSGGAVLVPSLLALGTAPTLSQRRKGVLTVILLLTAVVLYFAAFALGLWLARQPASPVNVIRETLRLLGHHAALTDMKNPWTSSWPTWLLPARPLMLGRVSQTGAVRVLSSLGNLAVWWASVVAAVSLGWAILLQGLEATWHGVRVAPPPAVSPSAVAPGAGPPMTVPDDEPTAAGFLRDNGRGTLIVLATALAFLAPWVLTRRDSYLYHFLPSYTVLVLLLGGVLGWIEARRPRSVLIFVLVVLLVAAFYAPVWSFFRLDVNEVVYRLFLGSWR